MLVEPRDHGGAVFGGNRVVKVVEGLRNLAHCDPGVLVGVGDAAGDVGASFGDECSLFSRVRPLDRFDDAGGHERSVRLDPRVDLRPGLGPLNEALAGPEEARVRLEALGPRAGLYARGGAGRFICQRA